MERMGRMWSLVSVVLFTYVPRCVCGIKSFWSNVIIDHSGAEVPKIMKTAKTRHCVENVCDV